jgi:hypothetical protein
MPTIRQKKTYKRIVENGGNVSRAMMESGYSPATAKTPQKLTTSQGWQELVEKYLPDNDLTRVHQEGLNANKIITSHTEPDKEYPDYMARHKYLETAYKIKGKLNEPGESEFGEPLSQNILVLIKNVYGNNPNADNGEGSGVSERSS